MLLHTSGKILAAALLFVAASVWAQKPDTPPTPATMPASQGGVAPFDAVRRRDPIISSMRKTVRCTTCLPRRILVGERDLMTSFSFSLTMRLPS